MKNTKANLPVERIEKAIFMIRGQENAGLMPFLKMQCSQGRTSVIKYSLSMKAEK